MGTPVLGRPFPPCGLAPSLWSRAAAAGALEAASWGGKKEQWCQWCARQERRGRRGKRTFSTLSKPRQAMSIGRGIGASWQSQPAPRRGHCGIPRYTQAQARLDKTRLDSSRLHTNFLDCAQSLSPPVVSPHCPLLEADESWSPEPVGAATCTASSIHPSIHPSFSLLGAARG